MSLKVVKQPSSENLSELPKVLEPESGRARGITVINLDVNSVLFSLHHAA